MQTISQAVSELSLGANLIFAFCNKLNLLNVLHIHVCVCVCCACCMCDKCALGKSPNPNWCINCRMCGYMIHFQTVDFHQFLRMQCDIPYRDCIHMQPEQRNWVMRYWTLLTKMIIHFTGTSFPIRYDKLQKLPYYVESRHDACTYYVISCQNKFTLSIFLRAQIC